MKVLKKLSPRVPFTLPLVQSLQVLALKHHAGDDTGNDKSNTRSSRDARGTAGRGGRRGRWRGASGSSSLGVTDGRARSAASGGGEGSSDTISRLISVGNAGSEGRKGPFASSGGVDGTVHTALAVRFPGTEEPDGVGRLGNLEGEDTDLAGGSIVWHKARVEAVSLGDGVELLGAGVGKAALSDGVVTTAELKVDKVTNGSVDDLWVEDETCSTSAVDTDGDSDVGGKGGDGTSESGESSSSELHVWYFEERVSESENLTMKLLVERK